jgi:hypothetical protein
MVSILRRLCSPWLICLGTVGLMLGGLLIGFEPVGGDPDRMYRPLKQELATSLSSGKLPWWSDQLGLGLPLLAESHVAALYPPNWVLYTRASVTAAYRLAMWSHYVLLAGATFAYARFLGISPQGAALAGAAFPFCGFQAIHSSHEPFYHALAYLPLILLAAESYLAGGQPLRLFAVACLWALQLTLGHFQLQAWTGGLVLIIALWRALVDGRPWPRVIALGLALGLGAAAAAVQLGASWELARFVNFTNRAPADLAFFGFPPEHWSEVAIPGLVRGIPGGPEAPYWYALGTTGYEACFYVGTVPLILTLIALAGGTPRSLAPWVLIIAVGFALAVLPRAWPAAQALLMQLPGFGWFRAPGRYVMLTSFGLCLAAGRGLDRASCPDRLRLGWVLVGGFAAAATGWSVFWTLRPGCWPVLGGPRLSLVFGAAALAWGAGVALVLGWRRARVAWWVVLLATLAELGCLYYTSTTVWGWSVRLPRDSRMLAKLADEASVGRVAGLVHNLPVRAGATPIFPYTGFAPPPPHPFLDLGSRPSAAFATAGRGRLLRHGVTHGLWDRPVPDAGLVVLLEDRDPVLDRLVVKPPGAPAVATWTLVRYLEPFPRVRAGIRRRIATSDSSLLSGVEYDRDPQTVWYSATDSPPPASAPQATAARVVWFDGETALVEHNGSCDLVVTSTYYPGWFASVNGGPEQPVSRAELGIQSVHLSSPGPSRVRLSYRPRTLPWTLPVSLSAGTFLLLGLLFGAWRAWRGPDRPELASPAARPQEADRQQEHARGQ